MKVSGTLRKVAAALPIRSPYRGSRFICDHLVGSAMIVTYDDGLDARNYMASLGMPDGYTVFNETDQCRGPLNIRSQHERIAWCLFAADLWDDGVR